jgi:uncharacterized protein
MSTPTLLIPGYQGSGPEHWQQWLLAQLPGSCLLDGIDWHRPVLADWASRIRDLLSRAEHPLTLVAHSFCCLAAVIATADRPDKVRDLILAAPADPTRFDFLGLNPANDAESPFQLGRVLPQGSLQVPGLLIGSRNDPWLQFAGAHAMAQCWELDFHDAGNVGHVNPESGFGPWPWLLNTLLERQQTLRGETPVERNPSLKRGRGSALAAVRQLTREQQDRPLSRARQR